MIRESFFIGRPLSRYHNLLKQREKELENIAVFSEKTDVPHLPNQSIVAISVMKLRP